MKKVLFAISVVALALVSCTEFEPETPVTFDRASAPSLTVNVTGDNSVAFEVLPGKNTGYYAYAFLKGEVDPATVDAATLLAGKLSGSVEKEVANAAKKDTLKNEVKKLTPNSKYTVVAVAACNTTQTLSKVVGQTVTTSDSTIPAVSVSKAKVEVADSVMVFTVPFDDPITLTDKAAFVVMLYAINYANAAGTLQPIGTAPVPAENVSVGKDGASLVVNVPKDVYVPGEFVALNIAAGSVKNDVDSLNAAFTANTLTTKSRSGLVGQYKNVNFDLESPIAEDSIVKFQNPATLAIELAADLKGTPNVLFYGEEDIVVTAISAASGRKVEYTLNNWDYDATRTKLVLGLDEAPEFGYYSNFAIAEGVLEDLYGNVNNALDIEDQVFCSYGYTLADITGDYNVTSVDGFTGSDVVTTLTIAASDNAKKGNMMFTSFMGLPITIYGSFDPDLGIIHLEKQPFTLGANTYNFGFYKDSSADISVPAAGALVNNSTMFTIDDGSSYLAAYYSLNATRI